MQKRRYREGRVFQRGNVWWYEAWNRGKRTTRSSASTKRQDAIRALNRLKAETEAGRPVGQDIDRTRFEDLVELIRGDYRANNRRSAERLEISLRHLIPYFRETKARDISSALIEKYKRERLSEPRTSNASVNRELAALRRMLKLGRKHGIVAAVPDIDMLEEAKPRKGFFERAEFDAARNRLPQYLRPVITAAYFTGWRVKSELLTRKRFHLDLNTGWLRLDPGETKSGEPREFPVNEIEELREALVQQLVDTEAFERATGQVVPWLFHHNGQPIKGFRKAWATACRLAGITRTLHDFRRTAVRNLDRAETSRSAAMAMVGHQTESIYRRYGIVDAKVLKEAGAKLGKFAAAERQTAEPKVVPLTRTYGS